MSAMEDPSFCACFTLEFMNTVHLVPRSTGLFDLRASSANSGTVMLTDFAYVSINEPQPEEQASFSIMLLIAPSFISMHFISWPPMSRIKLTSGMNCLAAL